MKRVVNIAISMGAPCGIGPEVLVKALRKLRRQKGVHFFVSGDSYILSRYGFRRASNVSVLDLKSLEPEHFKPGSPNKYSARASLDYLNTAILLVKKGFAHSLVTAPISKEAVLGAGFSWPGHTEFLADSFGSKQVEMVFVSPYLKVVLVTRHLSLKKAIDMITARRIVSCGRIVFKLLKKRFGIGNPKIAVCGLNPHAGEGGLFGKEDIVRIAPAVRNLNRIYGRHFFGPYPADTVFQKARNGEFDLVMSMYHDQGLIPFKLIEFRRGVNLTAGLPVVRTSPVHGTAFDIAGKNKADSESMFHSLMLAYHLSKKDRG